MSRFFLQLPSLKGVNIGDWNMHFHRQYADFTLQVVWKQKNESIHSVFITVQAKSPENIEKFICNTILYILQMPCVAVPQYVTVSLRATVKYFVDIVVKYHLDVKPCITYFHLYNIPILQLKFAFSFIYLQYFTLSKQSPL